MCEVCRRGREQPLTPKLGTQETQTKGPFDPLGPRSTPKVRRGPQGGDSDKPVVFGRRPDPTRGGLQYRRRPTGPCDGPIRGLGVEPRSPGPPEHGSSPPKRLTTKTTNTQITSPSVFVILPSPLCHLKGPKTKTVRKRPQGTDFP